jgi:hypothetical protein
MIKDFNVFIAMFFVNDYLTSNHALQHLFLSE